MQKKTFLNICEVWLCFLNSTFNKYNSVEVKTRYFNYSISVCFRFLPTIKRMPLGGLTSVVRIKSRCERVFNLIRKSGFKPQYCQATTIGPLREAPNPLCSRGAVSWLTLCPVPSFLTLGCVRKEFHCALMYI